MATVATAVSTAATAVMTTTVAAIATTKQTTAAAMLAMMTTTTAIVNCCSAAIGDWTTAIDNAVTTVSAVSTMATVTGYRFVLAAHQGDSNQREKHRKTHNNCTVHL
jgi:hypothetical protein